MKTKHRILLCQASALVNYLCLASVALLWFNFTLLTFRIANANFTPKMLWLCIWTEAIFGFMAWGTWKIGTASYRRAQAIKEGKA